MKITHHAAVYTPAYTNYSVEFRWKDTEYKCDVVFDNLQEASFYEEAIKQGNLQAVYSYFYGYHEDYGEGDKLVVVYAAGMKKITKSFSHCRYQWGSVAKFTHRLPEKALFCVIPRTGAIHSDRLLWLEFIGYDYRFCQSPYAKNLTGTIGLKL